MAPDNRSPRSCQEAARAARGGTAPALPASKPDGVANKPVPDRAGMPAGLLRARGAQRRTPRSGGDAGRWAHAVFALAVLLAPASGGEAQVLSDRFMVSTANPLATRAARDILTAGGGAVDAAVAALFVLTVAEPQASGLGGGAFLLHFDAASRAVESYDGRETAPAAASGALFRRADGSLMSWPEAAEGGLPVGVPGAVRMLALAHADHGRLSWPRLFDPAIRAARHGFIISPRLHESLGRVREPRRFPAFYRHYYRQDGEPKPAGVRLVNRELAATLTAIAQGGADAFYEGAIAEDVARAVTTAGVNPGVLTLEDMAGYRARRREPLCSVYRDWTICGMGPPSSGGLGVAQTLALLERFDMAGVAPGSAQAVHLVAQAERLAYADRAVYVADADFVAVPLDALLDPGYLARRSASIDPARDMGDAEPGRLTGWDRAAALREGERGPSTSHVSIVDADGNAVSMTASIERAFGSRLMAAGFLLNNELTDFSFEAEIDGRLVANRVEPGKRPRSTMAPTLVFEQDGRLAMAVGTVGGSRIIGFVVKTLIAALDWRLDIQAAIELPHHLNRNGATEIEQDTGLAELAPALEAMGHDVELRAMNTGLAAFFIADGVIAGGADPRREGTALGR